MRKGKRIKQLGKDVAVLDDSLCKAQKAIRALGDQVVCGIRGHKIEFVNRTSNQLNSIELCFFGAELSYMEFRCVDCKLVYRRQKDDLTSHEQALVDHETKRVLLVKEGK